MASEWSKQLLGSLCHEITVGFVGSMTQEYVPSGVPFLRSKNIAEYDIDWHDMKYVSQGFHGKLSKSILKPGDVAIVRTGKPGTTCVISPDLVEANCSDIVIARVNAKLLNPHYLAYFMNAMAHGQVNAHVVGAVQQHFNVGSAKKIEIPLPSILEQEKVVNLLKALDDKFKINSQINQTLEQMAQTLFKSWFVDFDPVRQNMLNKEQAKMNGEQPKGTDAPFLSKEVASLFPEKLVESELGLIPEGWDAGTLSDVAKYCSARTSIDSICLNNYISTENMLADRKGVTAASKLPTAKMVAAYKTGDVLVSNIRPYFKKIWLAEGNGGRSNDVLGFESSVPNTDAYLMNLLYQDMFFEYMTRTSKGAKMPRGDKTAIMNLEMAVPPVELREAFSAVVDKFYTLIPQNRAQNESLESLRDTLLPKLLSGEIELGGSVVKEN